MSDPPSTHHQSLQSWDSDSVHLGLEPEAFTVASLSFALELVGELALEHRSSERVVTSVLPRHRDEVSLPSKPVDENGGEVGGYALCPTCTAPRRKPPILRQKHFPRLHSKGKRRRSSQGCSVSTPSWRVSFLIN